MKINIPKLFLQSGNDLIITKTLSCKHPTMEEIFAIDGEANGFRSENMYYSWVSVFLVDPYSYMVYLDDKGLDYEQVKPFDLFIMLFTEYMENLTNSIHDFPKEEQQLYINKSLYFSAFKFFLNVDYFYVAKNEHGESVLGNSNNEFLMNEEIFMYISEFIKKVNGIPDVDKINPEDGFAKQILIEDEREKLKKSKSKDDEDENDESRLSSLLSSITWSSNGAINPFNRRQLHVYDLVDGVNRTDKLLNFKNTMTGLYSGTIDKKGIDFQKIHWSN